jgi:hypothetical protein
MGTKSKDGKKVVYTAAFLSEDSRQELAGFLAGSPVGQAGLTNLMHHVTFAFGPDFDEIQEFANNVFFGSPVQVSPVDLYSNLGLGIACLTVVPMGRRGVDLSRWVTSGLPHLTLGVGTGMSPAQSKDLILGKLEGKRSDLTGNPLQDLTLEARIGWFDGRAPRFDHPLF